MKCLSYNCMMDCFFACIRKVCKDAVAKFLNEDFVCMYCNCENGGWSLSAKRCICADVCLNLKKYIVHTSVCVCMLKYVSGVHKISLLLRLWAVPYAWNNVYSLTLECTTFLADIFAKNHFSIPILRANVIQCQLTQYDLLSKNLNNVSILLYRHKNYNYFLSWNHRFYIPKCVPDISGISQIYPVFTTA